ncbi:MAG TPA: hypothetical protein PKK56_03060 [archaeon]|nr:hypothetical protein [archaeon]
MKKQRIGSWGFIIGIIIAIIMGAIMQGALTPLWTTIMILLGLIVGFLNITGTEAKRFLFTGLCLIIITALGGSVLSGISIIGPYLQGILSAMMIFIIPAEIIVALKEIYNIAQD